MANLVKVAKVGEKVKEVALEDGQTVADALKVAKKTEEGVEVRLNGKPTKLTAKVRDNDVITLVPQIRGGC